MVLGASYSINSTSLAATFLGLKNINLNNFHVVTIKHCNGLHSPVANKHTEKI